MVVQAAHHKGGRDQLAEKSESRHLHCQGLQHLPRLLWPCLEGAPHLYQGSGLVLQSQTQVATPPQNGQQRSNGQQSSEELVRFDANSYLGPILSFGQLKQLLFALTYIEYCDCSTLLNLGKTLTIAKFKAENFTFEGETFPD